VEIPEQREPVYATDHNQGQFPDLLLVEALLLFMGRVELVVCYYLVDCGRRPKPTQMARRGLWRSSLLRISETTRLLIKK
jgi:hypothetical protein